MLKAEKDDHLQALFEKLKWSARQLLLVALTLIRIVYKPVAYSLLGGSVVLLIIIILFLNSKPDLFDWHTHILDKEFTRKLELSSFGEYLQLEDRLFKQLEDEVVDPFSASGQAIGVGRYNRYYKEAVSSPGRWPHNWNRSFELTANNPSAVVLLLHGMSDSPYSMRHLAESLHQLGLTTLGLRLPGHGTLPSGLVNVKWEDMAAALVLAMQYLQDNNPGVPIHIIGYSNGATLAINYALDAEMDSTLPAVDKLVLLSPSIEITGLAKLAIWQARIAHLLGLKKLEWQNVILEYDPFKYGSFAINAGDQVYRLTNHVKEQIKKMQARGLMSTLPPMLAFQSVVDNTVSATAVIDQLYLHLNNQSDRLVLLDLNREADSAGLLKKSPAREIASLFQRNDLAFGLDLLTNKNPSTLEIELRRKLPGNPTVQRIPMSMSWPEHIFSLSHVSLPFPPDDTLYGGLATKASPGVALGDLEFKGEVGVLATPAALLMRLRWNPFYYWMEAEIDTFLLSDLE
ncbi:MAG: alpha/beta fold hydrolase [Proteobacteria bacterium]|nr:alpha/beta fold hydrolase [Pseudomonadota bacterium]